MKHPLAIRRSVRAIVALCLGALLAPLVSSQALSQSASAPVGLWDFVLSGRQRGVAHIEFFPDGTLSGVAVFAFNGSSLTTSNGAGYVFTNQFGGATLEGNWIFEKTNRITGFINLLAPLDPDDTNFVASGLSFRGNAKGNKVTFEAFGPPGKIHFRGVPFPQTNIVDLGGSGAFLGTAKVPNVPFPFLEIFSMETLGPNMYEVTGGGPGYTYTGLFLVSSQRYAAFFQDWGLGPTGPEIAAYAGEFNVTKRRGTLKGTDGVNSAIRYSISPEGP